MTIEFSTGEYEWTYGKAPRGYGYWAFEIEGHEFWAHGKYGDAKKAAAAEARRLAPKGYVGSVRIKVLT